MSGRWLFRSLRKMTRKRDCVTGTTAESGLKVQVTAAPEDTARRNLHSPPGGRPERRREVRRRPGEGLAAGRDGGGPQQRQQPQGEEERRRRRGRCVRCGATGASRWASQRRSARWSPNGPGSSGPPTRRCASAALPLLPNSPGTSPPWHSTRPLAGSPCAPNRRPGPRRPAWNRPGSPRPPTRQRAATPSCAPCGSCNPAPRLRPVRPKPTQQTRLRPRPPVRRRHGRRRARATTARSPRTMRPARRPGWTRDRGGGGTAEPGAARAQPPGIPRARCRAGRCAGPDRAGRIQRRRHAAASEALRRARATRA